MAYQNEMQDIKKPIEIVRPYDQWQPVTETVNGTTVMSKVAQDSKASHKNSHDK